MAFLKTYSSTFDDPTYGVGDRQGYIIDKTITIGSWGFSQRAFAAYPAGKQTNCHKLAFEGRMQGESGLIRTTRSWHNWLDSINKISINTIL